MPFTIFKKLFEEAVIKLAASAASPKVWDWQGSTRMAAWHPDDMGEALPCKSKAVSEGALAADLIAASKSLWGGCASSQIDHGGNVLT